MADKIIFDNPWLKVKQSPHGFVFAERKGKDSIAVLLYRRRMNFPGRGNMIFRPNLCEFLVRHQPLAVKNAETLDDKMPLFQCPITGTIEDDPSQNRAVTLFETVLNEAQEEAGYDLSNSLIEPCGKYYAGTQCNETVHMFLVDVTGVTPTKIEGDGSYFEGVSFNKWETFDSIEKVNYSGLIILLQKLKDRLNS